jgi:hypothetical protein
VSKYTYYALSYQLNSSSLLSSVLSSGYRPLIVRSGRRQQGRGRLWCGGVAVHVEATAATARDGAVYGAAVTAPTRQQRGGGSSGGGGGCGGGA